MRDKRTKDRKRKNSTEQKKTRTKLGWGLGRYAALLPAVNASCQLAICANRVGEHRRGEIGRGEFEAAVGRPVDAVLPFDGRTVAAACNVGQPVVAGRGKVAAGLDEFAERICGGPSPAKRRLFGLWPGRRP
jgi:hypothetical protein